MGFFDFFKKKKDEEYSEPSSFQSPWPSQGQAFQEQQSFSAQPDFGQGSFNADPLQGIGQQQAQQYPGTFTPEQAGFERVHDSYPQSQGGRQSVSEINMGKDLELINAKLDAIKAELDSVNQRLKRMERVNEGEQALKRDQWNY